MHYNVILSRIGYALSTSRLCWSTRRREETKRGRSEEACGRALVGKMFPNSISGEVTCCHHHHRAAAADTSTKIFRLGPRVQQRCLCLSPAHPVSKSCNMKDTRWNIYGTPKIEMEIIFWFTESGHTWDRNLHYSFSHRLLKTQHNLQCTLQTRQTRCRRLAL